MNTNRTFKDSVFCFLFSSEDALRELYNAISGSSYDSSTPIVINTLSDVLFMERINDVSFIIGGKLVVLIEHQSTVNQNMPLRFLLYLSRIYEKFLTGESVYKTSLIRIPEPEFIVLYNGAADMPDESTLRLSDAFTLNEKHNLELTVRVLNINKGHNEQIARKSSTLDGYAAFMAKIREEMRGKPKEEALKAAVEYCVKHEILLEFLKNNATEVMNMLTAEWDWDVAKKVWQDESRDEGIQLGEARAAQLVAQKLEQKGWSKTEIQELLEQNYGR